MYSIFYVHYPVPDKYSIPDRIERVKDCKYYGVLEVNKYTKRNEISKNVARFLDLLFSGTNIYVYHIV